MGRKDTIFGVKYPNLLVTRHLLNYKEMSVGKTIYIRYVVISIILFTSMLAIEFLILHIFVHFMDVSLGAYLFLSLTGLQYILDKV